MSGEETAVGYLNENYKRFSALARAIWENPEIGLDEKFASKAIGWTRANQAVRKVGGLLPEKSAGRRVVTTMGDLLDTEA